MNILDGEESGWGPQIYPGLSRAVIAVNEIRCVVFLRITNVYRVALATTR